MPCPLIGGTGPRRWRGRGPPANVRVQMRLYCSVTETADLASGHGSSASGISRPREWDAASYDALHCARALGEAAAGHAPLRGDETVLDVGAGTGRDTAALLERLPRGRVIAVDGSVAMLSRLRARLAGTGPEGSHVADLTAPLPLAEPVDAAFSVATLHWLPDHERVFGSLAAVLGPGALLRAEWGGAGNCASIEAALAALGLPTLNAACQTRDRRTDAAGLAAAGFADVDVALVRTPARLDPAAAGSVSGHRRARLGSRRPAGRRACGRGARGGGAAARADGGLRTAAGVGAPGPAKARQRPGRARRVTVSRGR